MRFVWAVLAFVLAAVLIGTGIAQRTIFLGPKDVTAALSVKAPQHYTMIDGAVLRVHPGEQTLVAHGDGQIVIAQARTADLEAWLSDSSYNRISLAKDKTPQAKVVQPKTTSGDAAKTPDRNPAGSDLWLDSVTDKNAAIDRMQIPDGVSVLVASDGKSDAPQDIAVSWPLDTATPWAGPLMVAGGAFMLLGIVLYILAIRHSRRGRGPRRKAPPPLPVTEPIDVVGRRAVEEEASSPAPEPVETPDGSGQNPAAAERRAAERRASAPRRRRALLLVPAVGVAAALLSGCTPDIWPHPAVSPTPKPTTTQAAEVGQQAPAVTDAQAARILGSISATLADADKKLDTNLAGTRLDGPALDARKTAYAVRGSVGDFALPASIPADKIKILVPQAYDSWPRTVLMLVDHGADQKVAPLILTMTQKDPWSEYKIGYVAEMQASAKLPDMAPAWLGAKLTPPDSPFLVAEPKKLGADFADVIDNGDKSSSYKLFDKTALDFVKAVQDSRASVQKALKDANADSTSSLSFAASAGTAVPVAMSSIDSGAIVSVTVQDSQTIKPTSADAVIKLDKNPSAKALTGVDSSAKGFVSVYGVQLFFSVPAQGSNAKITLLAASQQLLSVTEIK
ncbi:glycosyl transferase [Microbacterium capsulatum]|uniref:Glycosyl transferase n=1 Tax=Microbacterium capsulatum TaxID=3041921 RepID=A0ABU0XHW1_9MICO|nr:glycosyl transferase [Microbacterium sp. ASV81]MDQ4213290.1 glycosyl transferase [Microbacterium sp. ASV81]